VSQGSLSRECAPVPAYRLGGCKPPANHLPLSCPTRTRRRIRLRSWGLWGRPGGRLSERLDRALRHPALAAVGARARPHLAPGGRGNPIHPGPPRAAR